MSWLTPLGFLGLIGLIVLLIIYLIKPNYQNKYISSTFIWKLSLKYRKKKIPISKLRNILLIICQMLIITACAFILAQPFITAEDPEGEKEKIIIIDASGSMRAEIEKETRFERAVAQAKSFAGETLLSGGRVSVILANEDANFIVQRGEADDFDEIMTEMSLLVDKTDFKCSYGDADIDGAMLLSEAVLEQNPKAEVVLYTGTEYIDDGKVTVKDVTDPAEWNVAILDVRATKEEGYDRYEVDVGSYAKGHNLRVFLEIHGVNVTESVELGDNGKQNGDVVTVYQDVILEQNSSQTITFGPSDLDTYTGLKISGHDYVYCYIQETDSMSIDNSFYLYGGRSQPLRIQYYSTRSNHFVSSVLAGLRQQLKDDWDIELMEIRDSDTAIANGVGKQPELTGYDVYIFEHHMPETLPTDGLVILINPSELPGDVEVMFGNEIGYLGEKALNRGTSASELLTHINAENITITKYRQINAYDASYTPILFVDDNPVVLAKNEGSQKQLIISFSLHYSNFVLTPEFPVMMQNAIRHFIPATFEKDVYDIYDKVELNSRSQELRVMGPGVDNTYEEFPATFAANAPGLYTVTQTPISGTQVVENFYVTIPDEQSNIDKQVDKLTNPYFPSYEGNIGLDLVFYIALAMVLLLFAEWWLKSRDQN